jgi:hypothetical protein
MNINMLRRTNITNSGGGQHNHYESLYKGDFDKKPISSANLNEELLKDLRKHHFTLGFDANQG